MRKKVLTVLFLITTWITCSLIGCTVPGGKETTVYGYIRGRVSVVAEFSKDIEEAFDSLYGTQTNPAHMSSVMWLYYKVSAQVRDVDDIQGNVTFVVDNYEEIENAVVTTKWLYYATLFNNARQDWNDTVINVNNISYVEALSKDEYCMEKVCLDWTSSLIEDESNAYYGLSIREASNRNGGAQFYSIADDRLLPYANIIGADAYSILGSKANGIRIAALQRYGGIQIETVEKRIGVITEAMRITLSDDGQEELSRVSLRSGKINVVGYIETEADKLLSTGVSMDKNSEEYKIVMQQLQNPVFYSVCGNFLEE